MRGWKNQALNAVTCLLTLGAAFVVWTRFHAKPQPAGVIAPTHIKDWRSYSETGTRQGPARSPVTLTIFSDYQCPFCRSLEADVERVRAQWPNEVAVVYRHFPLPFHPKAHEAAVAAICASRQGAFPNFHKVVFADQDSLAARTWSALAEKAGVHDIDRFRTCLTDVTVEAAVARDSVDGVRLGVTGTPTLLINDLRFVGSPGLDTLEAYIRRDLRDSRADVGHI